MARFPRTSSSSARLHLVSEWQMAWEGSLRRAYTEHTNLDPHGRRPSALGCTRTTPNMSKLKRSMRLRDARSRRACIHQPWRASRAEIWEKRKNHHHDYEHRRYGHRLFWQCERARGLLRKEFEWLCLGDTIFQVWASYGHARTLR